MIVPGSINPLLLTSAAAAGGYQIERSLRFNSSDSASLSKASYAGSGTFSCWVKRCKLGTAQTIISGVAFNAGDQLNSSTAVFRDPSAWMHVLVSTSGTYVNGTSVASGSAITPSIIGSGCDLYLADIHFIDGQALTPSSFTEVSATTGQLIPTAYTGSFTGNSFWLKFSDNSALTSGSNAGVGKDYSGLGNYWNTFGLSVTAGAGNDSLVDTPTSYGTDTGAGGEVRGNYATLNPLDGSPAGLSNGNLDAASANAYPTIIPGSGSWYYEVNGTGYSWDGTRSNWTPRAGSHNFGQRAFASPAPSGFKALCDTNLGTPAIAKPNQNFDIITYPGNGSTQTLPNATSTPATALDFGGVGQIGFSWIKQRSDPSTSHALYDARRGVQSRLESNTTNQEATSDNGVTAFNAGTFALGSQAQANSSSETYVAWCWATAAQDSSSHTQGSITSQVRANASAGFSIVTYTGNGTAGATIGHGLNVAPQLLINKRRSSTGTTADWAVWHKSVADTSGSSYVLFLNTTDNALSASNRFNSTAPTSSVFTVGNSDATNYNGGTFVTYAFAPVAGYSSFGSYTGNGSATDNTFVYTGMRPRFVMLKRSDSTGNWVIWDAVRNSYNVANSILLPNSSAAEYSPDAKIDILSNGFKVRDNSSDSGTNGATYIYAAFAESPFAYARAR